MKYAIYEGNMERLRKKMRTVRNKCQKYNCDFRFEEIGEEYREIEDENGEKCMSRFVVVEAEGTAIVNGWKLIASVEHTEKGNIIRNVCGVEAPERYYTGQPVCEHCKTNRTRKYTYIVMNEASGIFKQVGQTCLKDFTHGMSAEAAAEFTSAFDQLIVGETPYGGARVQRYYETETYLRYAAECIRHFGYVKSESPYCTSNRAADYLRANAGLLVGRIKQALEKEMESCGFDAESDEATKITKDALEWIRNQPEENNFLHNLKTICKLQYITARHFGFAAALFPAYSKDLERQERKRKQEQENAKSKWVAEVGQRIEIEVEKAACITGWETQWGYTGIYRIVDRQGNIYTWKTSCGVPDDIDALVGTVKAHSEYEGTKQTELTRCKVRRKVRRIDGRPEVSVSPADTALNEFLTWCET